MIKKIVKSITVHALWFINVTSLYKSYIYKASANSLSCINETSLQPIAIHLALGLVHQSPVVLLSLCLNHCLTSEPAAMCFALRWSSSMVQKFLTAGNAQHSNVLWSASNMFTKRLRTVVCSVTDEVKGHHRAWLICLMFFDALFFLWC